jgi:cytochrome c
MSANRQGGLTQIKATGRGLFMVQDVVQYRLSLIAGTPMRRFSASFVMLLVFAGTAAAATPAERRGLSFAKAHCARCHAIGRTGTSRFKPAPPFRSLHTRYPVETLAEAFAEGIYTGHPRMPAFELDPDQINDLLSYLKTLER